MVNLHGHAAGNSGYGQGDTYGCDRTSPTRRLWALGLGLQPEARSLKPKAISAFQPRPKRVEQKRQHVLLG